MDNAIARGEKLAYVRCFTEISASKTLPNQILLEMEEGERVSVSV